MTGILQGLSSPVATNVVPGGPAGDHEPISGLKSTSQLISVRQISDDLVTNADLTAEFSVSDDGQINNAAGTDTTGDFLVVTWKELT